MSTAHYTGPMKSTRTMPEVNFGHSFGPNILQFRMCLVLLFIVILFTEKW